MGISRATTAALLGALCLIAVVSSADLSSNPGEDELAYTIDQAKGILVQLLDDAVQNKKELENSWDVKHPVLTNTIALIDKDLGVKQSECTAIERNHSDLSAQLVEAKKYLAWLNTRIQDDKESIEKLLAQRCEQNGNFVDALKNDKLALKLIQFLRAQLSNLQSLSLLQTTSIQVFLEAYRKGDTNTLEMLEKQNAETYRVDVNASTKERTSDEVGVKHIDNGKGDLSLDKFQNGERNGLSSAKQELLDILTNLEDTITKKMRQGQEDEVNASSAAADYKLKLESEIEVFNNEVTKQEAVVAKLEIETAEENKKEIACKAQENQLKNNLEVAQKDLETQTNQFNKKQTDLQEEISVFTEVLNLYETSTSSQSDEFKNRQEDYIADGNFDNEKYSARQIPKINRLNN